MRQTNRFPEQLSEDSPRVRQPLVKRKFGALMGSAAVVAACITACEPSPGPTGEGTTTTFLSSADAERQADINTLESELELFFAQYNRYPTLANMNDSNWREYYSIDVDPETFKDPAGDTYYLTYAITNGQYSYQSSPYGCDNMSNSCTNFVLSAFLDTGNVYVTQG